jgi:short-subunit dehydrogenase
MGTALITGASAGLGAAFARALADRGLDLVLLSRDGERLTRAAETYRQRHGVQVEVLPADLTEEEGLAAAEHRLARGVDLLVNNAGFGMTGRFPRTPLADEVRMLRLHCEAVLRLTHAALGPMVAAGRGGVINVASVAAFFARGTYGASKAWVVNFSESVAHDIAGSGVRVMALCPGFVHTEFHERAGVDTSGIPGFLWLDADRVVAAALRDYARGAWVSVPSGTYKAAVGLARLVPRRVSARISSRAGRRH